jgi:hypothetical protein
VSKASSERVIYQVSDTDDHGILIDLLGHTLKQLTLLGRFDLKWSVFDLDWTQREDGILHWERVCDRSRQRPDGWQLDDSGIRLFHAQSAQVTDGLFLAGSQHVSLPVGQPDEYAVLRSELALQVFDAGFWRLSCIDKQVEESIIGDFTRVKCTHFVRNISGGHS